MKDYYFVPNYLYLATNHNSCLARSIC